MIKKLCSVLGTQSHLTDYRRFPRQILETQNATQKIETTSALSTSTPKISTTTTLPASTTFTTRVPTTEIAKTTQLSETEGTTSASSTEASKTTKTGQTEENTSSVSTTQGSTTEIIIRTTKAGKIERTTLRPKISAETTTLILKTEEDFESLEAMESQINNYTEVILKNNENATLKTRKSDETTTVMSENSSHKPMENKIKTSSKGSPNSLFTTSRPLTLASDTIEDVESTTSIFLKQTTVRSHVQKIPMAGIPMTSESPFSAFYNSTMRLEDFNYLLYPQNSSIPCVLASAQIYLDVADEADSNKVRYISGNK